DDWGSPLLLKSLQNRAKDSPCKGVPFYRSGSVRTQFQENKKWQKADWSNGPCQDLSVCASVQKLIDSFDNLHVNQTLLAKTHLGQDCLAAGKPKHRIKHRIRVANEREQVFAGRATSSAEPIFSGPLTGPGPSHHTLYS